MKFSAAFLAFGLVAAVAAQTSTESAASPQPTSAQQKCVTACKSDVDCAAKCLGNPAPTKDMVNATTECMAACPQGNGTAPETAKYAACQTKCINDQFLSNSGSSNSSSDSSSSDSGSGSSNSTATQTTGSGSSESGTSDSNSTTTSTSKTGGTSSTASDQPKTGTSSGASSFAISGIIGVLAVVSAAVALL